MPVLTVVSCGDTEIAAVNMRITIGKLSRTVEGRENIIIRIPEAVLGMQNVIITLSV